MNTGEALAMLGATERVREKPEASRRTWKEQEKEVGGRLLSAAREPRKGGPAEEDAKAESCARR